MTVLCRGLKVVAGPLQACEPKWLVIKTRKLIQWKFILFLPPYGCGISQSIHRSREPNAVAIKRKCVKCMAMKRIFSLVRRLMRDHREEQPWFEDVF